MQPFGQEGAAGNYAGFFGFTLFTSVPACSTGFGTFPFPFAQGSWNPGATASIGIKLQASTDWTTAAILYVDSIVITRSGDGGMAVPGPYTFDTSAAAANPFFLNTYMPVPNSRIDWVP
jgi:hypothetical protein